MNKKLIVLILLSIPIFFISSNTEYFSNFKVGNISGETRKEKATMFFVGDIMLSRHIGKVIEANSPDFPFELISSEISQADISFGNLENPVSDKGVDLGSVYSFRANPNTLTGLSNAGFDVVSLANNHILDWGEKALLDTLYQLSKVGIKHMGAGPSLKEARNPVIIETNGLKVGFLAYSQFAFNQGDNSKVSFINEDFIKEDIRKLKEKADVIAVSFHWGDEYETKANNFQKSLARNVIDFGADLVIGHHPHVVQEVEEYKGGVIAYSLGNFIFDQNFSLDTGRGLILSVEAGKEGVISFQTKEVLFNKNFQPYLAESI